MSTEVDPAVTTGTVCRLGYKPRDLGRSDERELKMAARPMPEGKVLQLTTLEHQFCIRCWMLGKRVRICSAAERVGRTDAEFKRLRRRLAGQHYASQHPEVKW